MKDRFKILTSPLFLLGLGLLLINDFYLKQLYGNWFTGKLSDISGLFIFPLFLTVLFPKHKIASFIGTAVLFIVWKMPISNTLIELLKGLYIPIGRTIDRSDLFTLIVLPIAYYYEGSNYYSLRIKPQLLMLISVFAFIATTLPPEGKRKFVNINKTYKFDFSRNKLIEKLNKVSIEKIRKKPDYIEAQFDSKGNFFYSKWNSDTLAVLLDSKKIEGKDTIHYKAVLADFFIDGNENTSSLTFLNAYKIVPVFSDKEYREKAIRAFEKKVIKKLKKKN